MAEGPVEPNLFVVFGGTGDLMRRKLLPALHHLSAKRRMAKGLKILGVARATDTDDEAFRKWAHDAMQEGGLDEAGLQQWCDRTLYYQSIGQGEASNFQSLRSRIAEIERGGATAGNRTFYLALPPAAFPSTIENLGAAGLNEGSGSTRLVIEKPFGFDLASARSLNQLVHRYFDESQVYRIDHYLGKETVQNLLVFRFANPVFESIWSRDRVESVQITVSESIGVGTRAGYYDGVGALRDMIQNHMMQLLTLTAMEVPVAFDADAIRDEKVKVLRSINPPGPSDVVLGQYGGGEIDGRTFPSYLEERGVPSHSRTETFAALRIGINNWRWQGVPFYLRTGKRLPRHVTQITVRFLAPPVSLFQPHNCSIQANAVVITLQPDEGFDLCFEVKTPGQSIAMETQSLQFRYAETFGTLPDGYETLLYDVLTGDQTLFVRNDEVERSWRLYSPLLEEQIPVHEYRTGSWGPEEAERLLAHAGDQWTLL